jgi:hypothetical protein
LVDDFSTAADIVRIELFRDEVYTNAVRAQVDNTTFERIWKGSAISLNRLGIPQQEIECMRTCSLALFPVDGILKETGMSGS